MTIREVTVKWIRYLNALDEEVIWYLPAAKADALVSLGLWEYHPKPHIRYRLRRYTMVLNGKNAKVYC